MTVTAPSSPAPAHTPATPCRARPAGRPHRRPAAPPLPHIWFAERLLGVLTGVRGITCLAGHVHPDVYDHLWHLARARTDWRHRVRAGHRPPALHSHRAVLVAEDILEVTAVVALAADRYRAIAFRLERPARPAAAPSGHAARGWRLTAVEAR